MEFYQYINQLQSFSFEQLDSKPNITAKLFYCQKHLKELAKGSSRVVFDFNDSVIKIAKNKKGTEQNQIEKQIGLTRTNIVPNLISFDENNFWNVFEKVELVTKEEFEEIAQITLPKLHDVLKYKKDRIRKNIEIDYRKEKEIQSNELLSELAKLIENYNLSVGDMVRISSWGKKHGKVLLIDFGLTSDIYKKYYKK